MAGPGKRGGARLVALLRAEGAEMRWLNRLPGFERSAPGWEWAIWKRLPAIAGWGTALPVAVLGLLLLAAPEMAGTAAEREQWLLIYRLVGWILLHLTLVLLVAITCAIVIVMKGPAFVADAYPLPQRRPPA